MSASTPIEPIPLPGGGNVETARFVGIYTVCRDFKGRLAGMREVRQEEIRHDWYSMKKRLFLLHGILNDLRDHKLAKTATATALLDNVLPLFSSTWRNLTAYSFWAPGKTTALLELEAKLAELEKRVKELLDQETQGPFEMALHEYHAQAIRAVIQSRIDLREYDTATRLCLGAGVAGVVDDQLPTYELVLKVCKECAETIYNRNTSTETSISCALKKLQSAPTTPSESTPLHAAADRRLFHAIELLLAVYHVDPVVRNGNGGKRPIDVIDELSPDEKDNEDFKRIYFLLDQCIKAQGFQQFTTAILGSQNVMTRESIVALTPNMTAIQDLQVILSLGIASLETGEFKQVIREAFQHVIDFKLVFNNDAAVYFKISLEQCFAEGYFTKPELEHWILEMSKVNMERAQWVVEIKQKIQSMQAQVALIKDNGHLLKTHSESLRQALTKKETQENLRTRGEGSDQMHAPLGGPALHLSTSLSATGEEKVAKWCSTSGTKLALNVGVDPEKFADDCENQRLDDFPYQFAIQQSHGDFEEFLHLLDAADEDDHDASQAHDVIVSAVDASTSFEFNFTRLTLPPHVFTSCLGYVDIVNHFRARKDFRVSMEGERMVVAVNRARKVGNATRMA